MQGTDLTMRRVFQEIDPDVRFNLGASFGILRAGEIARLRKIPIDFGGKCYCSITDEDGYIAIGVSPSADFVGPIHEWLAEQIRYPLARSVDRVDLLGNLLRERDSI